ncbi:MAG: methyltransferase domain-containing protein [Candidatus Lokiarchaeota archaeon]|nr:methyltransferase domain-containing protein [Candidatus Lokiarchaeota archaeon]
MKQRMSNLGFKFMALGYKFRDFFSSPIKKLEKIGIKSGMNILDFGCGPGSYIIVASKLLQDTGKVYALDILPIAVKTVNKKIKKKHLNNVETINSDARTDLPENHVDVILMFDVLHHLKKINQILQEMHRILKTDGTMRITDHHLKEEEIVSTITDGDLFTLKEKDEKIYTFIKNE